MRAHGIELMRDLSEVVRYERGDVRLYLRVSELSAFPGLRVPCHWHDDLECIHIQDGVMGYSVNGRELVLHAGDSLIVNSRQMHFGHDERKQDCRFLCLLFHPSLFTGCEALLQQDVSPALGHPDFPYWKLDRDSSLGEAAAEIFMRAAALKDTAQTGYELEIIGLLHILWGKLIRQIDGPLPAPGSPHTELDLQKDMVSYIYQNYSRKLTLDEIAASGRVSRSKCCQIFRRYLQRSPIDFLNDYRLKVSCHLLRTTALSVTEIALSCGINHPSYFSKMFVENFGCTPKQYRKNKDG